MAVDLTRQGSKGGDPQYSSQNLRGVSQERGIVVGIVKANVHLSHMGVIQVYIPEMSTDEKDKSQWRTVRYCSPFYSRVSSSGPRDNYLDTKVPAGIVTPPPDLGTTVLCFFPQGRNAEGYYFACVPDTFMMQSMPEPTIYEGYAGGEFNDKAPDRSTDKITNWQSQFRPVDFISQKVTVEQGLDQDRIRGFNNSGYMRESPSEIIGISSKGRRITDTGKDFLKENASVLKNINTTDPKILQGLLGPTSRRKGHSIALDDGDVEGDSNQIRLRTSTGHQILMNDTEGVIYVSNGNGNTWIELGKGGTIDVYASDSINFRTKNINFHADENIKFHSKGFTQIVSEEELHLESGNDLVMSSKGDAGITSKAFAVKASGMMNLSGGAASSISAGGIMSVKGTLVLLQGPALGSKTAKPVRPQPQLDPQYSDFEGGASGAPMDTVRDGGNPGGRYALSSSSTVITTVDRLPSHEPFVGHGQKNNPTAYTGGLSGGGGLAGAFSIISAGMSIASAMPAGSFGSVTGFDSLASGVDVSDFAGANTFGDFSDFAGANTFSDIGLDAFGGAGSVVSDFSDFAGTNTFSGGFLTDIGDTFTQFADTIGDKLSVYTDSIGDTIGKFGNSLTGTNITSADFPGFDSIAGGGENALDAFGGAGGDVGFTGAFSNISPSIDSIASSSSFANITSSWNGIGDLANSDLGKLVTDGSGKIIDIAKTVASEYETALPELQKGIQKISAVVPGVGDKLNEFISVPSIKGFPVTDLIKQVDTGFSIGDLESVDIQGLNAGIVKVVGSNNSSTFIDSTTKTLGKYGFDVKQLQAGGFVRPEAVFNDQLSQSSVWTGKDGITSQNKFLSNLGIQEQLQQDVIAQNYQTLVNNGGISARDGKPEIMAMLTGSAISNTDIAKQVRLGNVNIEGLLRNTSSIPAGSSISSIVKDAMQTGSSASKTVTKLSSKNNSTDTSGLKRFSGELKTGETLRNIGGVSYVVPAPTANPYTGNKGGEIRSYDQRIAKLEKDRNQLTKDGNDNDNIMKQISDKLTELYAKRNTL